MAPTIFSWRPKVIRIGRKTPSITDNQNLNNNNSNNILTNIDPVSVALPPSTINNNINDNNNYFNEINSNNNNENIITENYSQRIQRVRFSDGVGNNSQINSNIKQNNQNRQQNIPVHSNEPSGIPHPNIQQHSIPISNRQNWIGSASAIKSNEPINPRVQSPIAPLAIREEIEDNTHPQPPRPPKFHQNVPPVYRSPITNLSHHPRENRANLLLQQLRADDGALSESDVSTNEPTLITHPPKNINGPVIFLQYNDEVKRSQFPSNIRTIEQVKGLFLRSFPNLTHNYISQPTVKIYIQEISKGNLFYEFDDIRDIKDKVVLKLKEQIGYQSPPPVRFTDHPPPTIADYVSEPEIDDYRDRNHRYNHSFRMRPASAVPGDGGRMYNPNNLTKTLRSPAGSVSGRYDSYYDPYGSDTSSQGPRSGSVTPIIDKETRFRMDTMERQLVGLSSLVHSALVSKGVSESTQKDMLELRRQIMEFHPEINRPDLTSSLPTDSTTSSIYASSETKKDLLSIKKAIQNTATELSDLRRSAQMDIQTSKDIISDAYQKIQQAVYSQHGDKKPPQIPEENVCDKLRKEHLTQLSELQNSLRSFEMNVETIRKSVLNSNRKLRMNEVEQLTDSLTKIGRQAAKMKTQFPDLQKELEIQIKKDMERVVQEQNFLKEETNQIDSCLRRCKTLANMMVTMKKLAMVQDPVINKSSNRDDGKPPICSKSPVASNKNYDNSPSFKTQSPTNDSTVPTLPPPPLNYEKPTSFNSDITNTTSNTQSINTTNAHVLDTILDELTTESKPKINAEVTASFKYKIPPRPPTRNQSSAESVKHYSTLDTTNQQNSSYESSNSSNEPTKLSALSSSESIYSQEGSKDKNLILDNNKEKIDDKQRELNNQLEKLQQLCPSL